MTEHKKKQTTFLDPYITKTVHINHKRVRLSPEDKKIMDKYCYSRGN